MANSFKLFIHSETGMVVFPSAFPIPINTHLCSRGRDLGSNDSHHSACPYVYVYFFFFI